MERKTENLFGEVELIDDGVKTILFNQEDILESAFQYFREKGFPYPHMPLFRCKMELNDLANLKQADCLNSRIGYRIADTYNTHRFHSSAAGMSSPYHSFMDDTRLKKVLQKQFQSSGKFEYGYLGFMSLVNGTQACSNFRPAFAKMLYNQYCPKGGVVFDSSTGYGGRLTGFLASHCSEYHVTDPNTLTHAANTKLANDLKGDKKVNLYNFPAEDLDIEHIRESCDFSFSSPPYFSKERYSDEETQSWKRYPEYEQWLQGFLKPVIKKSFDVLKSGSYFVWNIEDVILKTKKYPLVEPSIEFGKEIGFEYVRTDRFALAPRTRVVEGVKTIIQASEAVIVFIKP